MFLNEDQSYNAEEFGMAVNMQNNTAMYGSLTEKAWYTRINEESSSARKVLNQALRRQKLTSIPSEFKEKWSGKDAYDYEVRIHKADENAPGGSNAANGSTLRVARRKQGMDENKQGFGWEYADDKNNWYSAKDLKSGNTAPNAQNDTHIPLK